MPITDSLSSEFFSEGERRPNLESVCRLLFRNLSPGEFADAQAWYMNLRRPELKRVAQAINFMNEARFDLLGRGEEHPVPVAVIVAGSSLDARPGVQSTYSDIDLFLLTQTSLYRTAGERRDGDRSNPKSVARLLFYDAPNNHIKYVSYGDDHECEIKGPEMVRRGMGAIVTVSLFYEFKNGGDRRPGHYDDLLEPAEPMGAEELIRYNRARASKFAVLTRQYDPNILD
jgi:hypothetical protein